MKYKDSGVSPVIAIIMMVAITIILAGAVTLWVMSLVDDDEDTSRGYFLDCEISVSDQEMVLMVISGEIIKTDEMSVTIDSVDFELPSNITLNAGEVLTLDIPAGFTVEISQYYTIKVIIDNKMVWDKEIIAGP